MPEDKETKPDYAPKNYEMPKMDFSDAKLEKVPTETKTKTYTVDSGDNLSNIAKQELGDAKRWREIYELNKDVIGDNPDLIQPGMELKLPS
jgi:nucleoid-associated protein YgaU